MIIVTAADNSYFGGLTNLVGSLHYWSENRKILVYDLGINEEFLDEIRNWKNVILIEKFLERPFPSHLQNLHNYAWKPAVMVDAIERYEKILWSDAGSDFRAPLGSIETALQTNKYFFVRGQDSDMTQKSMADTYCYMGADIGLFRGKDHFSGNLQGYIRGSKACQKILLPLLSYALQEECIAPVGSSLLNHRYDQTLLSILLYQLDQKIISHTEYLTAERHQLSSDPFQISKKLVYTARLKSKEYVRCVLDKSGKLKYA